VIKVVWDEGFKRSYKRKIKGNQRLEKKFWAIMRVFEENPLAPKLRTHKLSGKLKGLWAFSIDHENRVIFKFLKDKDEVLLIDIGSHNEVY